jgi:integrase
MLRSGELLPLQRSEVFLDAEIPYVLIPARRVKKRRDIKCPLSWLAIEILREAMADGSEFVFGNGKAPNCHIMADALRGRPDKGNGVGICAILGLEPFTGHDLRRTSATVAGKLGIADSWISACLDHQKRTITAIYNRDDKFELKVKTLDAIADRLMEIVNAQEKVTLRLAA